MTIIYTFCIGKQRQASAPQSNGIIHAYNKAVQIGTAREVADAMINLMDDYEAVHGAVTDATPKVFLKYFFVNSKTGEKSGEMPTTVKMGNPHGALTAESY